MKRAICPRCNGARWGWYYVTGDEGQQGAEGPRRTSCHVCNGDGRVSELHTYLLRAGRALAKFRKRRGQSEYDLAQELGIEPGDVQSMEQGVFSLACVVRGYTPKDREAIESVLDVMRKAENSRGS